MQFHEDIRPPWFGTWSKRSKQVTGRRPAAKDDSFLNYDVDSEAEWEEEEAGGESIKDDDSEKSADEDNYEIDNDIFVPHGYLSGSEGDEDEEIQEAGVFKEKDLLEARNRKLTKLRPISIGCVWEGDYKISAATLELLKPFSMVIIPPLPSDSVGVSQRKDSSKKSSKKLSGSQETKLNGQASAASPAVGDEKMVVD
ncbi:Chromatin assembly factor 1 subunit A [Halotydeus destructor]|nr:Chromatin assembly factor 1 subunit A [Halotydeus destructor]